MQGTPSRLLPPRMNVCGGEMKGFMRHRMKDREKTLYICVAFCLREGHLCLEQAVPLSCGSIEIYETYGQQAHL